MRALPLAAAGVLAAACGIPDEGPAMRPGDDCVACHGFVAAGTVYTNATDDAGAGVKGARVHLVGADGRAVTVTSNKVGNFFTKEKLAFPLQVLVDHGGVGAVMSTPAPHGRCNACHTVPPPASELPERPLGRVALLGGAGDEFMLPGFDCQACHAPGGPGVAWSAAGTVFENSAGAQGAEGVEVVITDARGLQFRRVTNRVGNFFLPDAIAFGDAARVRITRGAVSREMGELRSGSCNGCHRPGGEESRVSLVGGDDD